MNKLNVTAHINNRKNVKGAKVAVLTDVTIRLNGKKAVAFRTLGGDFNVQQALREFKRFPGTFTPEPGETPETVAHVALAA